MSTKNLFSASLAELLQAHLDTGKISIIDMAEVLEFYLIELDELAHLSEVEDNLVARSLRIAGRLT